MRKGIDISDNQGIITWSKVKSDGVQFAILRSTRGSGNADNYLASNIKGCLDNGIPFDFYKYMYATTTAKAKAEATRVVEVLKSLGVMPSKDTIIWADVEDKTLKALSASALTQIVDVFKDEVLASGYGFGLYMGKYDYESGELNTAQFDDNIWIARYYNGYNAMDFSQNPNEKYKPTAKAGSLWGWQYTSSGRVDGIKGNVDLNVAYYDIKNTVVEPSYYETPEFTLIDSLNKIGVDSSYNNRKRIAAANGILNYSGTAAQNLKMLEMLNAGALKRA